MRAQVAALLASALVAAKCTEWPAPAGLPLNWPQLQASEREEEEEEAATHSWPPANLREPLAPLGRRLNEQVAASWRRWGRCARPAGGPINHGAERAWSWRGCCSLASQLELRVFAFLARAVSGPRDK